MLSLSVTDVEDALGTSLFLAPQTDDCSLGVDAEAGFAVLHNNDTAVIGFVTEDPEVRTAEGIRVGSSTDDLVEVYGDAVGYLDGVVSQTGGPMLVVDDLTGVGADPTSTSLHYGFDTDEAGSVTRIRAGFWPWVGYTDYCSPQAENPQRTGWPLAGSE